MGLIEEHRAPDLWSPVLEVCYWQLENLWTASLEAIDFWAQQTAAEQPEGDGPAVVVTQGNVEVIALLRVFTNGVVDDRIEKAAALMSDGRLSANEKLTKIDGLVPFPATASAEQLGQMLGVSKQAVQQTEWWIKNRKGEKDNQIGRRRACHQERAKSYEPPDT